MKKALISIILALTAAFCYSQTNSIIICEKVEDGVITESSGKGISYCVMIADTIRVLNESYVWYVDYDCSFLKKNPLLIDPIKQYEKNFREAKTLEKMSFVVGSLVGYLNHYNRSLAE